MVKKTIGYITRCPLCGEKVTVTANDIQYGTGIINFPAVCDECKSLWAELKKKYIGEDTNVTTKESEGVE